MKAIKRLDNDNGALLRPYPVFRLQVSIRGFITGIFYDITVEHKMNIILAIVGRNKWGGYNIIARSTSYTNSTSENSLNRDIK